MFAQRSAFPLAHQWVVGVSARPTTHLPWLHLRSPRAAALRRSASTALSPLEGVAPSTPPGQATYHISSARRLLQDVFDKDIGGEEYWSNRLKEAELDSQPRPKRVSVYGDELAAPKDVVASLLQTPFSDSHGISDFILERQKHESAEVLKFSFLSQTDRKLNELGLPSGWLRQSGADLYEISGRNALAYLLRSDIRVIVVDPYRLLETDNLRSVPSKMLETIHVVVNGTLPPNQNPEQVRQRIVQRLGPSFAGAISFCNATLANEAYAVLRAGGPSPSPSVVSQYQALFLASGIGPLQTTLVEAVKSAETSDTGQLSASLATAHAEETVRNETTRAQQVLRTVQDLRAASEHAARRAKHLSVASRSIDGGTIQGSVGASSTEAAARLVYLLQHRLSWLSLLFRLRVDDIAEEVDREIGKAFTDVEQQLVYEAGQLYQIQQQLSAKADKLIRRSPPPFGSAVLTNRLSTLSLSIPAVESTALLAPIRLRREQLRAEVIPPLQLSGRRLLFQTYLGAAGGAVASWAAYVPPIEIVSGPTAFSLALLSSVGAVYWGQMRWQKAQSRFWRAWTRCTELLGKDLHMSFDSAVDTMVAAKPCAAAEGLEDLAQKRLTVLENIERRLQRGSQR